jgi:hypothetical protein
MVPIEPPPGRSEIRELNERIHRLEDLVAELLLKNEVLRQQSDVQNSSLARHFI